MKKVMVVSLGALLLLGSCGTYTGTGAYTGATFGSIIGSAIGGISGGPRGSDIGTLIGMAGGAAAGAAVGSAADRAQQRKYEEYRSDRQQRQQYNYSDSGVDVNNGGDDRLYGFGESLSSVPVAAPKSIEIRHVQMVDASRDGVLTRGEEGRVVFEIYNNSDKPVYGVQPSVTEVTGNRHIHISENILIESIMPRKGIRYTASVKADNGLRDGEAVIRVGVLQGNKEINSLTQELRLQTRKR